MSVDAHVAMAFPRFLLMLCLWYAFLPRVEKEGAKTRAKLVKQLEDTLTPSSIYSLSKCIGTSNNSIQ